MHTLVGAAGSEGFGVRPGRRDSIEIIEDLEQRALASLDVVVVISEARPACA